MTSMKNKAGLRVEQAIARSVDFELTVADIARRSERRAWWVATSALVVSLALIGGYFYILPLKEKVPYLVMADAFTGTKPTYSYLRDEIIEFIGERGDFRDVIRHGDRLTAEPRENL